MLRQISRHRCASVRASIGEPSRIFSVPPSSSRPASNPKPVKMGCWQSERSITACPRTDSNAITRSPRTWRRRSPIKSHRNILIPCAPKSATASDDACARKFLSAAGRLLYRRPLQKVEIQALVGVSKNVADKKNDFYAGISTGLVDLLISPDFLFRYRTLEPDPAHRVAPGWTAIQRRPYSVRSCGIRTLTTCC